MGINSASEFGNQAGIFEHDAMKQNAWRDVRIEELQNVSVQLHRACIRVVSDGGIYVFKKRALTQLLHHLGYSRRALKHLGPEAVSEAVKGSCGLVLSTKEIEPGVFYVYRVASYRYVSVPHRILFSAVDGFLRDAGIQVPFKVQRHAVRTVACWKLAEAPLKYARRGDALEVYLAVSNANTGQHSVKVFGYANILMCANGFVHPRLARLVRVFHVSTVSQVISKVLEAVKDVVGKIKAFTPQLAENIELLQSFEVGEGMVSAWLQVVQKLLPRKYHGLASRALGEAVGQFGRTKLALFQATTNLYARLPESYRDGLNRVAVELLEVHTHAQA